VSRLGVGKRLMGGTAGRADLSCPKGYPGLYEIVLSKKSSRKGGRRD